MDPLVMLAHGFLAVAVVLAAQRFGQVEDPLREPAHPERVRNADSRTDAHAEEMQQDVNPDHQHHDAAHELGQVDDEALRIEKVTAKRNHSDLGRALLRALLQARILVAIESDGDELEDTYFPLAGRLRQPTDLPTWALDLANHLQSVSDADRQLVLDLARRLSAGR